MQHADLVWTALMEASVGLLKNRLSTLLHRGRLKRVATRVVLHVVAVVDVYWTVCRCSRRDADVKAVTKTLPCCLSGVWWTRRTSWATSSRSRCLQKCGTGWPPPSPARWAWCCDATRRNPASAASCTLSRPEYLWRGKFVSESAYVWRTEHVLCFSNSVTWEKTYWLSPQSVLRLYLLWCC